MNTIGEAAEFGTRAPYWFCSGPQLAELLVLFGPAANACTSQVYAGEKPTAPNPDRACATSFGNTDTMAAAVAY